MSIVTMDTLVLEVTGSKQATVCMVTATPLVAVVMAQVKFSLFAYSGNTDCRGNSI